MGHRGAVVNQYDFGEEVGVGAGQDAVDCPQQSGPGLEYLPCEVVVIIKIFVFDRSEIMNML